MTTVQKEVDPGEGVTIDVDGMEDGMCKVEDIGNGDKRAFCKERGKLKIFDVEED